MLESFLSTPTPIFFTVGIVAWIFSVRPIIQYIYYNRYAKTTGLVLESSYVMLWCLDLHESTPTAQLKVRYSFTVDKATYVGDRLYCLADDLISGYGVDFKTYPIPEKYLTGKKIIVRYNPLNPNHNYIVNGPLSFIIWTLVAGSMFIFLAYLFRKTN